MDVHTRMIESHGRFALREAASLSSFYLLENRTNLEKGKVGDSTMTGLSFMVTRLPDL
jgi:hypothetical protein